jgi:hypothetical protein
MSETITETYALYHGDCCDVLASVPDDSIHLSVYSPPFCGLYHYSSSERDMSNCRSREEFLEHYEFLVEHIARITMPGRLSAVHVMDVPVGDGVLYDFAGDVIRMHERHGFYYVARHAIWKPPLQVRMRTMARGLAHRTVCEDSSFADVAGADYVLMFRKRGENKVPIVHAVGFLDYAGARKPPAEVLPYRGWTGDQTENRYSHWIWRQYASSFWDDIRIDRVVPFEAGRDEDDEKHVHPLQLDVIDRIVELRSNPGETIVTPFMGVGSEVYGAIRHGRKAIGVELKESYYRQAVKNVSAALSELDREQVPLFEELISESDGEYSGKPDSGPKNPHTWKSGKKKTIGHMEQRERMEVSE